MSNLTGRVTRLEGLEPFATEPRTFAELAQWVEQDRGFAIGPGSIWWPLWQTANEGGTPDASD